MRALRSAVGLALVAVAACLLFSAVVGFLVSRHRDGGSFTAPIATIHADGQAIVVPDLAAAVHSHGGARVLGDGQLRITAQGDEPLVLVLAPAADAARYLDGVARTQVVGVGYAHGQQPVELASIPGAGTLASLPPGWTAVRDGRPLDWAMASDPPMSLLILRADGQPGVTADIAVALRPAWLGAGVAGLLLAGIGAFAAGALLLLWPGPRREMLLVVDADRVADVAGRIAERISARSPRDDDLVLIPAAKEAADWQAYRDALSSDVDEPAQTYDEASAIRLHTTESPYVSTAT
jgi:hypothetical protein